LLYLGLGNSFVFQPCNIVNQTDNVYMNYVHYKYIIHFALEALVIDYDGL